MRIFNFILLYFLCISYINAQKKFDFDTTVIVGKDKQIYQQRQIEIDSNKNIYVASFFKGSLTIGNTTLTTNSPLNYFTSQAIFLAKYDSNMQFQWLKKVAESDTLNNFSFDIDMNGNFLFSMLYRGKIYYENDSINSVGDFDILLLNYGNNFNFKHKNVIGNFNGEGISDNSIAFDKYGNYYLCGWFNSTWAGNYSNYKLGINNDTLVANNADLFIAKFDSTGVGIWAKSYGGSGIDALSTIFYYDDNLYFMGGLGASNNNNIGGIIVNYPLNYYNNCFISKLDSSGNGLWVKKFGSTDINGFGVLSPKHLKVQNNRVYFTGFASSNIQNNFVFDGGNSLIGSASLDYFIAAYDTSGNFKWNVIANSPYDEYLANLLIDGNSGVYGIGNMSFSSYFPDDTLFCNGANDILVCSYDSIGNFRWATHGGGTTNDVGNGMAIDKNGKIFIVGGTTSSGGCYMGNDTLYPPANQSTMFFASLDSIVKQWPLGNVNINVGDEFNLFPNPCANEMFIKVSPRAGIENKLEVLNAMGQYIYVSRNLNFQSHTSLDVSTWPNGVYFVTYTNNKQSSTQKMIIQH